VFQPSPPLNTDELTEAFLKDLDAALEAPRKTHPAVIVHVTGGPMRDLEEGETIENDLKVSSAVSAVGVAVVLWLAYGSHRRHDLRGR
jgi:hypothetical protein